jgi:hypothetical protein
MQRTRRPQSIPPNHAGALALALALATLLLLAYHVRYLLFAQYASLSTRSLPLAAFYFVSGLGHQAFTAFFVIHGACFAQGVWRRRASGRLNYRAYLVHKIGRTYAVLLPVLLLGLLLDGLGARYLNATGVYTGSPEFSTLTLSVAALSGQLIMAQPFLVPTFGSNGVLYVLAFEWWYCALLLLVCRAFDLRRWLGTLLCAGVLLLALRAFPSELLSWGCVWLLGAGAMRLSERARARPPLWCAVLLCLASAALSRYMELGAGALQGTAALSYSFLKDITFGLGLGTLLLALPGAARRAPFESAPGPGARARAALERCAYPLFLGHFPLMMFIVAGASVHFGLGLKQAPDAGTVGAFALILLLIYGAALALCMLARRPVAALLKRWYRFGLPHRGRAGSGTKPGARAPALKRGAAPP